MTAKAGFPKKQAPKPVETMGHQFFEDLQLSDQPLFISLQEEADAALQVKVNLFIKKLQPSRSYYDQGTHFFVKLQFGVRDGKKLYVVSNTEQFLEAYQLEKKYVSGNGKGYPLKKDLFSEEEQRILDLLLAMQESYDSSQKGLNRNRDKLVPSWILADFIAACQQLPEINFKIEYPKYAVDFHEVLIKDYEPKDKLFSIKVKKVTGGYVMRLKTDFQHFIEGNDWLVRDNAIYRMVSQDIEKISNVISVYNKTMQEQNRKPATMNKWDGLFFADTEITELQQFMAYFQTVGLVESKQLNAVVIQPHFLLKKKNQKLELDFKLLDEVTGQVVKDPKLENHGK